MTVAALIFAASPDDAVDGIDGRPLVRRLVEAAWAGGAVPVIVVVPDPDGAVATALAGTPATIVAPVATGTSLADVARAGHAAQAEVAGTDAVLVWPAAYAWVDPETLGSQIEAHGTDPASILRPGYEGVAGWPVLVPISSLDAVAASAGQTVETLVAAAGDRVRVLELGDPGATHDRRTPHADLPPYHGPVAPMSSHAHEWGSPAAELPEG